MKAKDLAEILLRFPDADVETMDDQSPELIEAIVLYENTLYFHTMNNDHLIDRRIETVVYPSED